MLELCGGQVTDAGVNQLRDLRGLTALSLAHNKRITDVSVLHFAGMQRLRQLNLAQSAVTDNGIQPLARIPVCSCPDCDAVSCLSVAEPFNDVLPLRKKDVS